MRAYARCSAGSPPASRSASASERERFTGYSVSVANNKAFGGGMFIAPDADLSDGEFDVVTVGEVGKLRFLGNLPKVFKGTHVEEDEVRVFRASRLELSASRPFPVYADGEHLTDLPATLRVLPAGAERDRPAAGRGVSAGPQRGAVRRQAPRSPARSAPPAGPAAAAVARLCRGDCCCGSTAGDRPPRLAARPRLDPGQRHQRQDDDGGHAGGAARRRRA